MRPLSAEKWKQVIPAHGFVLDPSLTILPAISHLIVTMIPQGRSCTPSKDTRGTSTEPLGLWARPSPLSPGCLLQGSGIPQGMRAALS